MPPLPVYPRQLCPLTVYQMLPWEYRFTSTGASACNCRDPIEHRSESFATTSPVAANYMRALKDRKRVSATGTPGGNPEHPRKRAPMSSCLYFRSGFAFEKASLDQVSPILGGAATTVDLTLNTESASVPLFPEATSNQEEAVCQQMAMSERINLCFFGIGNDFSPTMLPTADDIAKLATTCAGGNELEDEQTLVECCQKAEIQSETAAPRFGAIIRLDLASRCSVRCSRVGHVLTPNFLDARGSVPENQASSQQRLGAVHGLPKVCVGAANPSCGWSTGRQSHARPYAGNDDQNPRRLYRHGLQRSVLAPV